MEDLDLPPEDRALLERLPEPERQEAERKLRELVTNYRTKMSDHLTAHRRELEKRCAQMRDLLGDDAPPDVEATIRAVLERLPLRLGADLKTASLSLTARVLASRLEARQPSPASAGRVAKQLGRLEGALDDVFQAFIALDAAGLAALLARGRAVGQHLAGSHVARDAVRLARGEMEARAEGKRGRPLNHEARAIASEVAQVFEEVTGRAPTRSTRVADGCEVGAFTLLLKDIFELASIEASAESQARRVVEENASQSNHFSP